MIPSDLSESVPLLSEGQSCYCLYIPFIQDRGGGNGIMVYQLARRITVGV